MEDLCCSSVEKVLSDGNLLTEILSRLPLRSIFRSRFVCKRWFSVISDPYFQTLIPPSISSSGLLLQLTDNYSRFGYRYDFLPFAANNNADSNNGVVDFEHLIKPPIFSRHDHWFIVHHSCNGLMLYEILFGFRTSSNALQSTHRYYYVSNPTTKQATMLPEFFPGSDWDCPCFLVTLAFNPRISPPRYRVVCFLPVVPGDTYFHAMIYSSETATWKSVLRQSCPMAFAEMFGCGGQWVPSGVYWNEAIHWICDQKTLVYFNIEEECFHQLAGDDACGTELFESRDHLLLFKTLMSVWEIRIYDMDVNYSGWRAVYSLDLRKPLGLSVDMIDFYRMSVKVHCILTGEREDDLFFVMETHDNKLIRYNIVSETWEELCYVRRPHHQLVAAFPFIESYCKC